MYSIKTLPKELQQIPRSEWGDFIPPQMVDLWASKKYVVQIYDEGNGVIRLSVNRTMRRAGGWADKIAWDTLQMIKDKVGYGDKFAVEVYPQNHDVVNVANFRHLWILPEPLPFAWTNESEDGA